MSETTVNSSDIKTLIKNNIRSYSMFIMLALIMIIFAPLTGLTNWSPRNFTNIFFQNSYVLILAIGMVQVIIVQGIDLSVGSVCAMVGALSAMIYNTGVGMPVTLLASLVMGVFIGAYQGAWVAFAKMPAFIVTLSGMMLFRGLTYIITKVSPISLHDVGYSLLSTGTVDEIMHLGRMPSPYLAIAGNISIDASEIYMQTKLIFVEGPYLPMAFILAVLVLVAFFMVEFIGRKKKIANGFEVTPFPLFVTQLVLISILTLGLADRFARYRGLPVVVLVLGIAVLAFHFLLNNTVLGRYIYAVGGNPRSATLSGINSEMVTFIVFCFMGGLTGLAAVVSTGYMNSALPQAGNLFELDAIAACYIGGVSAGGGIGSVIGVVVGGLVMSAINNGMTLMNLGQHYQYVVKASILILAVFYDVYSRRKAGLG
jgi:putative multiple sugar transport system permease protein